jgi:hypothetical protein
MRVRLAVGLLATACAAPAAAQVPAGGEFQVTPPVNHLVVGGRQTTAPNGDFVVLWSGHYFIFPVGGKGASQGHAPTYTGLNGKLYDAAGTLRSTFVVRPGETYDPPPAAAFLPGGAFIVVWQDAEIYARVYDRTGVPRGADFVANSYLTGSQMYPEVASDAAGNVVIAWSGAGPDGPGAFARRFDSTGAPRGGQFRVSSADARLAGLTFDGAGRLITAWHAVDGSGLGVFARRFDGAGTPLGPEFRVNSYTTADQTFPSVAADRAGNFILAWSSAGQDGDRLGVFAQRLDAAGAPRGNEFRVNSATGGDQAVTAAACDGAGNCSVAWHSSGNYTNGVGTLLQRYNASGTRRGAEFLVADSAYWPTLGADRAGNLVAASVRTDGLFSTLMVGQRLGGILPAPFAVDTAASAGSDGNRVLEAGESVDVRPAWKNLNGTSQTLNGTALGLAGPPATGVSYQLQDGAAAYGTVPDGSTAACSDCYEIAVGYGGMRPAVHWDAILTERLSPDSLGQTMPWALHIGESFGDVPRGSPYYRDIETLLHRGVTAGCSPGAYCPGSTVTREQLAAFVLIAREGAGYVAPACSPPNMFTDVPETSIFCDVIEELARRGVVGGCAASSYCPSAAVTREQMPVFVLRLLDPALNPPACAAPMFTDVPASSPFCRWIEELARRGVVGGCGGGRYCPTAVVTREQMAVFLAGTYGLSLYGP